MNVDENALGPTRRRLDTEYVRISPRHIGERLLGQNDRR